jgi:hypothetical protein
LQVQFGIVEDRLNCYRKGRVAVVAMVPLLLGHLRDLGRIAVGANGLTLPAGLFQMSDAGLVVGEAFINLNDVHGMLLVMAYPMLRRFSRQQESYYLYLGHSLLMAHLPLLTPKGRLILGVPDCGPHVVAADLSMFVHEHWSYFTEASLTRTLQIAGFGVQRLEKAAYGGSIYAVAEPGPCRQGDGGCSVAFDGLAARLRAGIDRVSIRLREIERQKKTVGVFCPSRFVNYLQLSRASLPVRFFDDDTTIQNGFYPPLPWPVESREQLLNRPVDELFVMSRAFGEKLKKELRKNERLAGTRILLPGEVIGEAA